jgi:hypothetical protein
METIPIGGNRFHNKIKDFAATSAAEDLTKSLYFRFSVLVALQQIRMQRWFFATCKRCEKITTTPFFRVFALDNVPNCRKKVCNKIGAMWPGKGSSRMSSDD